MNLIVKIPEDIAGRLSTGGGDLTRRAREAFLDEDDRLTIAAAISRQRSLNIEYGLVLLVSPCK
jgi:hypothetical protein